MKGVDKMISVLFVCLGNLCRSPMAEAVFRELIRQKNLKSQFHIDSAGIREWHIGKPPHPKTREVLSKRGISFDDIYGRRISKEDLENFDWIIVMDQKNHSSIKQLAGKRPPHVYLLTDFISDTGYTEVPDPFHTGEFEQTYQLIQDGCQGLLKEILSQNNLN